MIGVFDIWFFLKENSEMYYLYYIFFIDDFFVTFKYTNPFSIKMKLYFISKKNYEFMNILKIFK